MRYGQTQTGPQLHLCLAGDKPRYRLFPAGTATQVYACLAVQLARAAAVGLGLHFHPGLRLLDAPGAPYHWYSLWDIYLAFELRRRIPDLQGVEDVLPQGEDSPGAFQQEGPTGERKHHGVQDVRLRRQTVPVHGHCLQHVVAAVDVGIEIITHIVADLERLLLQPPLSLVLFKIHVAGRAVPVHYGPVTVLH